MNSSSRRASTEGCSSGPPARRRGLDPLAVERVARRLEGEVARAGADRASAEGLYEALMRVPQSHRCRVVEGQDRYASFAVADRLLEGSRETRVDRPEESRELASLALAVTRRLDPSRYGSALVFDLEARAWAYLGDAWSRSAPQAAREAFRLARSLLRRGSGDPLEEAEVTALTGAAGDTVTTCEEVPPSALGTTAPCRGGAARRRRCGPPPPR